VCGFCLVETGDSGLRLARDRRPPRACIGRVGVDTRRDEPTDEAMPILRAKRFQDAAIVCKHCGRDLATGTVPGGVVSFPLAVLRSSNSRAIIDHYTRYYVQCGYASGSQTDTSVQTREAKAVLARTRLLWLLLLFVGLFIYISTTVSKKDRPVYVHGLERTASRSSWTATRLKS